MKIEIMHDMKHQMFMSLVEGGTAYLKYEQPVKKVLQLKETFVPTESRRKGIAGKLVKQALEFAKKDDFKIIPDCPYVKHYLDNHSEFRELVLEEVPANPGT